jgi:hypothetical protein
MSLLSALADLLDMIGLIGLGAEWRDRRRRADSISRTPARAGAAGNQPSSVGQVEPAAAADPTAGWTPPPARVPSASGSAGCLVALGLCAAAVGPLVAVFTLMGGAELAGPITFASCAVAGLLVASGVRGVRGAIVVQVIPVGWALVTAWVWMSMSSGLEFEPGESEESLALLALFVLLVLLGTECGYVTGRFLARRRRGRPPMSDGVTEGADPRRSFEASRSGLIARMTGEGLEPEAAERLVDAWEEEAARRGLALGSGQYWAQAPAWVRAQAQPSPAASDH